MYLQMLAVSAGVVVAAAPGKNNFAVCACSFCTFHPIHDALSAREAREHR